MLNVSSGGIEIAQQLVPIYGENPNVSAFIIGGSVSRYRADSYSDLEIGVFWHAPPSDAERQELIDRAGGELWTFHPYNVTGGGMASEHYGLHAARIHGTAYTGTLMVDTKHMMVTDVARALGAVLKEYDTSLERQVLLSTLMHGIPLHGNDIFQAWRSEASRYPEALAIKIVQENLWFGPWFSPAAYAGRDDMMVMYQHFIWGQQALLRVLAALNRIYYPSREYKWMDGLIAEFTLTPLNLAARLRQVFAGTLWDGWRCLRSLMDDTIALVEMHLPAVDTAPMFDAHPEITIAWAKQRWEPEPPYTLMQAVSSGNVP